MASKVSCPSTGHTIRKRLSRRCIESPSSQTTARGLQFLGETSFSCRDKESWMNFRKDACWLQYLWLSTFKLINWFIVLTSHRTLTLSKWQESIQSTSLWKFSRTCASTRLQRSWACQRSGWATRSLSTSMVSWELSQLLKAQKRSTFVTNVTESNEWTRDSLSLWRQICSLTFSKMRLKA